MGKGAWWLRGGVLDCLGGLLPRQVIKSVGPLAAAKTAAKVGALTKLDGSLFEVLADGESLRQRSQGKADRRLLTPL